MADQPDICSRLRAAMHPATMNGNPDALLGEAANVIAELRALTAWQPMSTAPKGGEIVVWAKRAGTKGALIAHWACDHSGEYQPSFQGWFYWTGHGFTEVCEPEAWMPLSAEKSV